MKIVKVDITGKKKDFLEIKAFNKKVLVDEDLLRLIIENTILGSKVDSFESAIDALIKSNHFSSLNECNNHEKNL